LINKIYFTFLLIFSLSLLGDPYAPLNFPSYNPFTLKFIHFDNKTLGNYRETNHLSISVENSSFAVKENINNDQLTLDGEIAKVSINYFRKVSDNLTLNVSLPIYSFNKGFLDNPIEQWHDLFGLSDGSRVDLPKSQLNFEVLSDSNKERIQDSNIGIGDIQISTKLNFYSKNRSDLYLITSLEIPTGSIKKYFGNDEFGGLIALNLKNHLKDNLVINSVFGVSIINQNHNFVLRERNTSYFSKVLLSWKPQYFLSRKSINPLIYKINFEVFEPKIKSDFKTLGDEYYVFGLGATFEFAKDKYFNFGFSEDLKVNSSADFSFIFGFEIEI
jgi:hypothetical protein|tara:strand:- start:609 stop:1598 length:990 start_codon:yes stop_codon:yes gene_type:complete